MHLRRGCLWVALLLGGGCQTAPLAEHQAEIRSARVVWQEGQAAMSRGAVAEAVALYGQSLAIDPKLSCNHLSLAAAYLEGKNFEQACLHLGSYLQANPDKVLLRARYAELLLDLGRLPEAREEFERFVAEGQEPVAAENLPYCHRRLMEIAQATQDDYNEHLHRGIGLFLLARQCSALPEQDEQLPAQGLLFKAAAELTLARQLEPNEARPCWYLYEVWSQLGQRQPALCRLREADLAAPFSYLTPAEQCALHVALDRSRIEATRQ